MARRPKNTKPAETIDWSRARKLWQDIPEDAWLPMLTELRSSGWKQSGPRIKGRCHVHDEQDGSLDINPSKPIAGCYGCKTYWADPIKLVASLRECSLVEAAKWLRDRFPSLKKIIDSTTVDTMEAAEQAACVRDNLVRYSCQLLAKAIKLGSHEARGDAQMLWCEPTIDWLTLRRFGAKPGERPSHDDLRDTWIALCDNELLGVVPRVADIREHFGEMSDEHRAYSRTFEYDKITAFEIGYPLLPYHTIDKHVGRIKVRKDILEEPTCRGAKYLVASDPPGDDPERIGYYGLRAHSIFAETAQDVIVIEGETGVLQAFAQEQRLGDAYVGNVMLALGGGAAGTVDPLTTLNVQRVRVIGDCDRSGDKFVRSVAEKTAKASLRVWRWPDLGEAKKPDEAILAVGYPRWFDLTSRLETYTLLTDWCAVQAEQATLNGDDVAARGKTAVEWGQVLHDAHDRASYVADVATRLGIEPKEIERQLAAITNVEDLGDHLSEVVLARRVLSDLRSTSDAPPVHALGAMHTYNHTTGTWVEYDDDAIARAIMSYDKAPCYDGAVRVKIDAKTVKGVARLAAHLVGDDSFFEKARAGITFANGFLRLEGATAILDQHAPEHRARVALPFDYTPCKELPFLLWDGDSQAPRFMRFLFQCLTPTFCVAPCATKHVCTTECPSPCNGQHVCWPVDRASPPTTKWLHEYFETRTTILAVLEFIGICLLGLATKYAKAMVSIGEGENGKSTLQDIIKKLFPGAHTAIYPDMLDDPQHAAKLAGSRINLVPDAKANKAFSSGIYKSVISGDHIDGKIVYKPVFTFRPEAGHIINANDLPPVTDQSHGFWRRHVCIPWRHQFGKEHRDVDLAEKIIKNELPGIASMAIRAALEVIARGHYTEAKASTETIDEWKIGSNPVKQWVAIMKGTDKHDEMATLDTLFAFYKRWAEECNYTAITIETFRKRLVHLKLDQHTRKGTRYRLRGYDPAREKTEAPSPADAADAGPAVSAPAGHEPIYS